MSEINYEFEIWQGDPNELYSQEALLSMFSRSDQGPRQEGDIHNGIHGTQEQQSLLSMPRHGGLEHQHGALTTIADGRSTVPVWQASPGVGEASYQRLGFSMMFSTSRGGRHNIYTSLGRQQRAPMLVVIGESCASNSRSTMSTEHMNAGPVITEIDESLDEEGSRVLDSVPAQESQKSNFAKLKNKNPVLVKTDTATDKQTKGEPSVLFNDFRNEATHTLTTSKDGLLEDKSSQTSVLGQKINEITRENINFSQNKLTTVASIGIKGPCPAAPHLKHDQELFSSNTEGVRETELSNEKLVSDRKNTKASSQKVSGLSSPVLKHSTPFSKPFATDIYHGKTAEPVINSEVTFLLNNAKNVEVTENNSRVETEQQCETQQSGETTTESFSVDTPTAKKAFSLDAISPAKQNREHDSNTSTTVSLGGHVVKSGDESHVPCDSFSVSEQKSDTNENPRPKKRVTFSNLQDEKVTVTKTQDCDVTPGQCRSNYAGADNDRIGSKHKYVKKTTTKLSIELNLDGLQNEVTMVNNIGSVSSVSKATEGALLLDQVESNYNIGSLPKLPSKPPIAAKLDTATTNSEIWTAIHSASGEPKTVPREYQSQKSLPDQGPSDTRKETVDQRGTYYQQMASNMRELVKKEDLIVKDVYPDGNCLFAAVVDQLRIRGEFFFTPRTLRDAAVEYLRNNPHQPDGTPLYCFVTDVTWDDYLDRMARDGEWGDHLIISAISNVLNRTLVILGGPSGLGRTIQQPDNVSTRNWTIADAARGSGLEQQSQGPKNVNKKWNCDGQPVVEREKAELDSLYLGHLAESHYVSLRKQDWEEQLHEILKTRQCSCLLTYDGGSRESSDGNEQLNSESSSVEANLGMSSLHLSFLISYLARNAVSTTPIPAVFCTDVHRRLHHIELVGPTALGMNPQLLRRKAFYSHDEEEYDTGQNLEDVNLMFDVLYIPNDTDVVKEREVGRNKDVVLNDEGCFPGYTRLVPVEPSCWGRLITDKEGEHCLKHTRCFNRIVGVGTVCMQKILAFKYKWPEVAIEWASRKRRSGWPSKHIIEIVVRNGCHFYSPLESADIEETLWKYSFASAEKILITLGLSEWMKSCFVIFKTLLDSAFGKQKLNVCLFLSVFFYCCEELPKPDWERHGPVCLLALIKKFRFFLENDAFPNYFVPSWNLFHECSTVTVAEWYLNKIRVLERNVFVSIYFMLDKNNLTLRLGNAIDTVIEDEHKFVAHKSAEVSFEECFSMLYVEEIQSVIMSDNFNKASTVIRQVFRKGGVGLTGSSEVSFESFLVRILSDITLRHKWCFAVYWDYINGSNLVQQIFGNMKTVPIATVFGPELNMKLIENTNVKDILMPVDLMKPLQVLHFVRYFCSFVLHELELHDMYCCTLHFFLQTHGDFLRESAERCFSENKIIKGQKILTYLSSLYGSLYTAYSDEDNVYPFTELLDGFDKVCDIMNIPEQLQWMAQMWRYLGNLERSKYCETKAQLLGTRV